MKILVSVVRFRPGPPKSNNASLLRGIFLSQSMVLGLFGEATAYVGDPKVFSLQGAEALFFSSSPGSACAAELNFFTAYPSGNFKVGAKGGFGTCGPEVKTTLKDDSIIISVSGFGGHSGGYFLANPSQKKQIDKDSKIKHYWKYKDGFVIPLDN